MRSGATAADAAALSGDEDPLRLVRDCLEHLRHLLPAQAPLRDFVHHNTLHAFQHQPFAQALAAAARLTGARPWFTDQQCSEFFRQGRVTRADLEAALRHSPACRADEILCVVGGHALTRGDVLRVVLLYPQEVISVSHVRWQIEEGGAGTRLAHDLDPAMRERFLRAAATRGEDEAAAVADLWQAAKDLRRAPCARTGWSGHVAPPIPAEAMLSVSVVEIWRDLCTRLGSQWLLSDLLTHLTGEDVRDLLQPMLVRHVSAHLDQGLAAWRNPAGGRGLYAAWRSSAASDWGWELEEVAGARQEVSHLPSDPLAVIVNELQRVDLDQAQWPSYLQRLALDRPGWAGMCHWREVHAGDGPPVRLADFLAVRLVLERLYAESLVRRLWGVSLNLTVLADCFVTRPAELRVRHAYGSGLLDERMCDRVWPLLGQSAPETIWRELVDQISGTIAEALEADEQQARAAWPLFMMAQRLGLAGHDLRSIGVAGVSALLACARSLTADERGHLWLLAYEHHYAQQILAALAANHLRATPREGAAQAQFILCMDDREEGMRRHLEEVDPAFETFGAAGFFGVPVYWRGVDDEQLTALCPIVVRPTHTVCEQVAAFAAGQHALRQRRRRVRLRWRERLHQRSRRGWLASTLMTTVAAPLALFVLLLRTLCPGGLGTKFERWRARWDLILPSVVAVTADLVEAARQATPESPRLGFSEEEQVARVGGLLRTIGLTRNFAPLVIVAGHGSDSQNNPHRAAYDCGACSGRHGGPNARILAAMANRPSVRSQLAEQGIVIPESTHFLGAEHNTCDETLDWFDLEQLPATHHDAFAALRRACAEAAGLHAVERCRRFASAPRDPSPRQARRHLVDRRHDLGQARPELGHATVAAAFVGRRSMSRGVFFDRRVFLISYDSEADAAGRILEATLLAAGPVGAGINLEYYFSTVDNEGFGCGSKVTHNLAGLLGVMQGACSDLRTGLPLQMVEIHEPMRLLVVVEQRREIVDAIYDRQPALQELIGNGWILLATIHPQSGLIEVFEPATGWQSWRADEVSMSGSFPEVDRSADWFSGQRGPLPPALLRRPLFR